MNKYMHLLNGSPAYFDGSMIGYACNGAKLSDILVDKLGDIHTHRGISNTFRRKRGWEPQKYSYWRVRV